MNFKLKLATALSAVMLLAGGGIVQENGFENNFSSLSVSASESTKLSKTVIKGVLSSTAGSLKIKWNAVSNADGYDIYHCEEGSGKFVKVGTVGSGSDCSFVDKDLKACTVYGYRVKAFKNTEGKVVYGESSKTFFTATKPSATKITSAVSSSTVVRLNWKKVRCSGYRIYRLVNGKWVTAATVGKNTTSYRFKGLKVNNVYTYKIAPFRRSSDGKLSFGQSTSAKKIRTKINTPVSVHGRLSVKGNHIVDKNGNAFKIKGMSTHGIMWENFGDVLSYNSLKVLRDDWKCNTIRIAMYTQEWGGYTTGTEFAKQAKAKVTAGVENAKKLGMYAVIDWHILSDNDPRMHQSEAVKFFAEMAKKYKGYNNVIYEICNEPNGGVTWNGGIKSYCQAVVRTIRKYDKNAIIVCGTGTWSQDIDQVLGNRLNDKNCVYTLHFYANTHGDWLRDRLKMCYNKGLPVLVTEFGTCDASGNGGYNKYQSQQWLSLLDKLKVGYVNWSLADKNETASAFRSGTNLSSIKKGTSQLTESGKFIRNWLRTH